MEIKNAFFILLIILLVGFFIISNITDIYDEELTPPTQPMQKFSKSLAHDTKNGIIQGCITGGLTGGVPGALAGGLKWGVVNGIMTGITTCFNKNYLLK